MNESYFESIFAIFDEKPFFLDYFGHFLDIFGHFSHPTSINDSLANELNYILNWISRIFFELNNILNWILGKALLNGILNESFFGKIQQLNWIRLGIGHRYLSVMESLFQKNLSSLPHLESRNLFFKYLALLNLGTGYFWVLTSPEFLAS